MNSQKSTAVVLNMGANGLGVARSLGRHGIPVLGMDFVPNPVGFHSKYVNGIRCPDPTTRSTELLEFMAIEGEKLREKGVLYPCTDAFLQFVSRNRKELSKWYELTLPKEEVVEGLVKKIVQYEWARKLGVPIPQTFFPRDLKEAHEIRHELRYPAFIKGQESHLWARQFNNKGFIVRGPDELERRLQKAFEANLEVVVQKIIMPPGKHYGVVGGYIGVNGNSTPMLTWRKGRQTPPNFGIGCFLVSERIPELMELGSKFMKGIGFIGPGVIGFKFDLDDQEWKLIEMNGRLWFQNYFLLKCGYNLPLMQYCDATGESPPQMGEFKEGVRWWDSLSDFDSFVRLRREGRIGPREWIKSWFLPDVTPYFERGDIRPFLAQSGYGLAYAKEIGSLMKMKVDEDAEWDNRDQM
jgi:D-aspartate ligase